ncbi:MAG: homoserine dehydrogenase [Myxococcota bacterium]
MKPIRIGLLGCGVVGTGILRLLSDNAETIEGRLGSPIEVKAIAVRNPDRARDPIVPAELVTADGHAVATHPEVDAVVEVMGGLEPAGAYVKAALEAGKHVITANKALLAEEGDELLELAEKRGVDLYFEAAVAGGIPIIRVLREGLASDRIVSLRGIVNGTSNYILSRMREAGLEFSVALQEAQEKGYAEADPTLDIGGGDAQHKLSILATLAYGARVHPSEITTEGIEQVSALDMSIAERFGYVIKPLAIARPVNGSLELRVHPALVPDSDMLASISGALNAVFVRGAMLGPCLMSGPGAGALPTAMSVVSDLVDVSRNMLVDAHARVPTRAFRGDQLSEIPTLPASEHRSRYYLRCTAVDRAGVLARIAGILGGFEVSIEQMVQQHSDDETANLVMFTHEARWGDLRAALAEIERLAITQGPVHALRIED